MVYASNINIIHKKAAIIRAMAALLIFIFPSKAMAKMPSEKIIGIKINIIQ
jgi:hypothetical protein